MKKFFTASDAVVPVHHPRVLFETAVALGADRSALLENVGITAATLDQPDARISYDQFSTLERNARRLTNDPALGLRWGRATQLSHSGLVGIAAISSENLEAAFRIFKQYVLQLVPGWDVELRVENQRAYLTVRETIARGDLIGFATEAVLAGLYGVIRQALGRDFAVTRIRLNYPRPAHHALYAELLVDTAFLFDEPITEVEFDPKLLAERIVTADPGTASRAEQICATDAARGDPVRGVAAEVRKVLVENGARRMSLEEAARFLQTSTRSLRRALSQTGTSFHAISEGVLRERAEERVRSGLVKIEHIAQELGFTDARSFRRAFKRWTGLNPNDFRRGPDHS